jgi:hypothetical protein
MADHRQDCATINQIFDQLQRVQRQIPQVVKEARALGFGTAETADLIRKTIDYLKVLDRVPTPVWSVLFKFVRCDNKALADLAVADLKVLVEVLYFQALLQLSAESDNDLKRDLERWAEYLKAILDDWLDTRSKDAIIATIAKAKDFVKTLIRKGVPWILNFLIELYGDELLDQAVKGAIDHVTSRKYIFKKLAQRVIGFALNGRAATKAAPLIELAVGGWDLIVELAAGSEIADLQAYADQLLAKAVQLMTVCGFPWPSKNAMKFNGDDWEGVTVTVRPFVRCATMVGGKLVWGAPCATRFLNPDGSTALERTKKLTAADKTDGGFLMTGLDNDPASIAACTPMNAVLCYFYRQATFERGGEKFVRALVVGAKVMK